MEKLIAWIADNWFVVLTTAVTVCSVIAKVTPNETDNRFVAVLQRVVDVLAMSTGKTSYTGDRLKMDKGGFIKAPLAGVLVMLALVGVICSGCALKNLPPEDQAIAVTDEITNAYMSVRAEYLDLRAELPPDKVEWMVENVAPILDEGRDVLILTREAAASWKAYKVKPDDFDGLVARVRRLVADAWAKISQLTGLEV
ncbi:hypothetical protein GO013_15615 [Pseudodesulfovibrio sp. JC047]|uniref:hypothetical protein n=1 Tax=Pseudodesulfovibrio sp. JC047 TaxID=2683199 RepID=UPI0013D1F752|nr:hypothetical protein [Pseudodesulfovibrio sp. JC047]NDV20838.1 hypothetical protein [Pseudodesulfovibrio sp. JC047]